MATYKYKLDPLVERKGVYRTVYLFFMILSSGLVSGLLFVLVSSLFGLASG